MTRHLHRDLDQLRQRLLDLGDVVENAIHTATAALFERDAARARAVVAGEREVDSAEVRIEEECLKVLALHQPVAADLRFVIAVLKVDNDLERMGDAAESISNRALQLLEQPPLPMPEGFQAMVTAAKGMVRKALRSLVEEDVTLARQVLADDDAVDAAHRRMFDLLQDRMRGEPATIAAGVLWLSVSRQIERIADLATNIAEDVIFVYEGEIVRHRRSQLRRA